MLCCVLKCGVGLLSVISFWAPDRWWTAQKEMTESETMVHVSTSFFIVFIAVACT